MLPVFLGIMTALAIALGAWVMRREQVVGALKRRGFDHPERSYLQSLSARTSHDPEGLLKSPEVLSAAAEANLPWSERGKRKDLLARIRRRMGWEQEGSFTIEGADCLAVGQDVEIFTMDPETEFCARGTVIHRDQLHIVVGTLLEQVVPRLVKGMRVQVGFWRFEDAGYVFCSEIVEHRARGLACLILSSPKQIERRQKRLYVRVEGHIVFDFFHVPRNSVVDFMGTDEIENRYKLIEGVTENLGVGGCQIVCNRQMAEGDLISIPDFPPAGREILARVVTVEGDSTRRLYRLQFLGLSGDSRTAITRRVFELQLLKTHRDSASQDPAQADEVSIAHE